MSKELYKIHSISKDLFSLPAEAKLKLGPSILRTNTPHFIASPFFASLRVSGPDFSASAQGSADVLSPPHVLEFRETLQEYGSKMTEISKEILRLVLMILGDEPEYYNSEFSNCRGYMRINNYTPPDGSEEEEAQGLGMHTDMSCITIVYQDEIGGLQVKSRDGKWMDILPCEGNLVVNIGDLLQAWSNDKFRSSEHRVVLRKHINRFSLDFISGFVDEKVILAPDDAVGKGNCRLYKPFVCSEYLKFRENNEKGKFEKVGYAVKDFCRD